MAKIERVDEQTVRAYFDALDPLVRPEMWEVQP